MPRQIYTGQHDPSGQAQQLAPSPLYTQQRMTLPPDYFDMTSPVAGPSSLSMAPQPRDQQSYEPYSAGSAPTISLPPSHRPSSGAWSPEDDQQLMAARAQGLNWSQIRNTHFPNKTPNACRKRHERLAERRDADDWDNRKLQRLAKEYMSMRKEIWSGLAQRTGEKWNVVEQKCMSNGLKNLQSASRAASRNERLRTQGAAAAGASYTGYDDDSGISGIGLTPVDDLDASYSSPSTSSSGGGHSASSSTASASFHGHPHASHHHHHHQQPHPVHMHPHVQLQAIPGSYATLGSSYSMAAGPYPGPAQHHHHHQRYSSSPEQQSLHLGPEMTSRIYESRRHR